MDLASHSPHPCAQLKKTSAPMHHQKKCKETFPKATLTINAMKAVKKTGATDREHSAQSAKHKKTKEMKDNSSCQCSAGTQKRNCQKKEVEAKAQSHC